MGCITLSGIVLGPLHSGYVGYWLSVDHVSRGIATEALGRALEVAFHELSLHRVAAHARAENTASLAVLARNGFTRVGVLTRHLHIAGRWRDEVLFERLAPWDDGVRLRPCDGLEAAGASP